MATGSYLTQNHSRSQSEIQDGDRFNSCRVIYSQFGLAIHQNDHQARRRFVEWAQNDISVVPDFNKRILFSDEAQFWLNYYVNKQNCRIWSEAKPQVCVETPLHTEKLTVWCALWAGGIIGPYFFKNDDLRERKHGVPSRESPTAAFCQRVVRPKSVIKFVSESVLIRRACAYISRRFTSVFWRGFCFETQSAFLIGLESAEGYLLAIHDSPKTREIPKNNPNHDVFMGTLPSSRRGKRVTLFGGVPDSPLKHKHGTYQGLGLGWLIRYW
ncbi:DUF4817 domain-containing protein [Trichonephila clavipes]|nr:DUF4817 domain-containing protein [Trichonephila clavipes]